jgi:hypothetical protein
MSMRMTDVALSPRANDRAVSLCSSGKERGREVIGEIGEVTENYEICLGKSAPDFGSSTSRETFRHARIDSWTEASLLGWNADCEDQAERERFVIDCQR